MSIIKLDYSKKQTMQISNDAFYFLHYEEEPIDESNLEEAQEIIDMFPNGFYIEDNWKTVDNSDLIEATFVPYVLDDNDFDEYYGVSNYSQIQIKWINKDRVKMWVYNSLKCTRELRGEFDVHENEFGNRYFCTGEYKHGKGCLFFIKNFKKRGK